MRKLIDIQCTGCGVIQEDRYVDIETLEPHSCGAKFVKVLLQHSHGVVIGDDIPGGVMVEHGICNADGTPKRYDSRSEIRRACAEKGFKWGFDTNHHIPQRGSDKSPHTTKWN